MCLFCICTARTGPLSNEGMSRDAPRLYLESDTSSFSEGRERPLLPGQGHYLGTVMRQDVGSVVHVFNERDGEWTARIVALRKDRGAVVLGARLRAPCATVGTVLLFAPLKRDATELVVRMGTELGVTHFLPVITERTNTHRLNRERLGVIAREAAEQCERLDVPAIEPPASLLDRLACWPADGVLYAALERYDLEHQDRASPLRPPSSFMAGSLSAGREAVGVSAEARDAEGAEAKKGPPDAMVSGAMTPGAVPGAATGLLIGPEGGFSQDERVRLQTHPYVRSFTLGPRVLRAETAVCAGLTRLASWT